MKALILSLVVALSVTGAPAQSVETPGTVTPMSFCNFFPWFPGCPK